MIAVFSSAGAHHRSLHTHTHARTHDRCPYCQKLMLLIEEKQVPVRLDLVPMRSYGDKPREFLQKVPGGLLPAIEVNGKIITESQVIMELLDQWHTVEDGYKPMLPDKSDAAGWEKYNALARLERE